MLAAPRLGSEWLGFAGAERALPAAAFAAGNLANQSQTQLNEIVASFRNVWSPWIERAKPNGSFGVSFGGEDLVGGRPLGYVGSLTYSESQEIRHREARATTRSDGTVLDSSSGSTGTLSVLWGGLLNLTARLGDASTVSLSNTYTRSADNQATRHLAYDEEHSPTWGLFDATRLTMIERSMRSHQLRGEHLLAGRHGWTWSATASTVRRYEPDRSDLRYETDTAGGAATPTAWFGQVRSAVRTFSDLVEDAWEGASALSFQLGAAPRPWRLKVGGTYRSTTRDADTRAFDISNRGLTDPQRRRTPELVFSAPNALDSAFILAADAVVGRYGARDHLLAGYAQVEMPLSARVQIIGGARVERWALDMTTTVSPRPITRRNTDLLPALTVNVKVNTAHALRLSASQTLARPEYRELSPTGYRDFIGGFDVYGNDTLRRTLIRNYDARWEWYPNPGEILSLGVFAKDFDGPIEKVITGSTGADALTFVNASGGRSYGLELELRKNLLTLIPALAPFSVFANATFMHSRIEPGSANLTNAARPMVGQAPYVVNLGLTYTAPTGVLSATALYNVVGRRVHEAGSNPRPDAYEEARNLVDVSIQAQLWSSLTVKLDGKNLLDDPMHVTQGAVTRLRYTTGRVFSLGLTWQP